MSIKKIKNIFSKSNKKNISVEFSNKEKMPDNIIAKEIEIKEQDNFIIFDIKDDCSLEEYMKSTEKYDAQNIESRIANNTLFDENFRNIKKKRIYLFTDENKSYNIYSNDYKIHINERIYYDSVDEHIDERIISIDKLTKHYRISRLKHRASLSTYYVKGFSSDNPDENFFHIDESEALKLAKEVIGHLRKIENIDKIINLDEVFRLINRKNKQSNTVFSDQNLNDEEINKKTNSL